MATPGQSTAEASPIPPVLQPSLPSINGVDITEIYCPAQDDPIVADIVFVHGLGGHPKNTWLYGKEPKSQSEIASQQIPRKRSPWANAFGRKKSSGKKSDKLPREVDDEAEYCFWPYDLLPKDDVISQARILLYGYDSHPTHFYKSATNQMTISKHADALMHNVASMRSECRGRPLIFVAHSLGGILVKGALIESGQRPRPEYADLLSSCRAIIFMGTPHLGSQAASLGTIMSDVLGALPGGFDTYKKVIEALKTDSEILDNISKRFNEILDREIPSCDKIEICSVQEGQGLTGFKGAGSKVRCVGSRSFELTRTR